MLIAEGIFITTQYLFLLAYFQLFEDENSDFMFASTSSTVPTVINKYSLNKWISEFEKHLLSTVRNKKFSSTLLFAGLIIKLTSDRLTGEKSI